MNDPWDRILTVKLTIEGMRAQVMHCLMAKDAGIRASIERETDAAIKAFDWEQTVRVAANSAINDQLILAVNREFAAIFQGKEVREKLAAAIRAAVLEVVR